MAEVSECKLSQLPLARRKLCTNVLFYPTPASLIKSYCNINKYPTAYSQVDNGRIDSNPTDENVFGSATPEYEWAFIFYPARTEEWTVMGGNDKMAD